MKTNLEVTVLDTNRIRVVHVTPCCGARLWFMMEHCPVCDKKIEEGTIRPDTDDQLAARQRKTSTTRYWS